ncbi:hypothetical protein BDV06DRAFT_222028 [Aspergillus oleicola]
MPEPDDTPHFTSIPWVASLLHDRSFITVPISYRTKTRKLPNEDRLFSTTLNTPSTIAKHLAQYRIPPNLPQAQEETQTQIQDERSNCIQTDEIRIFVTLGSDLDGYADVLHGGMVSTLLDETMGLILVLCLSGSGHGQTAGMERPPVTAYLNTRFLAPVITPGTFVVSGKVESVIEGRKWKIRGDIRDGEGRVLADAECLYVAPRGGGSKI